MLRLQDLLFVLFALAVGVLLALHMGVAVFALVGAFVSGAIYLLIGMLPAREEAFWPRVLTTLFLSVVLAALVLILPHTLGPLRPDLRIVVIAIAGLVPLAAVCFEVLRTPRILEGLARYLGRR